MKWPEMLIGELGQIVTGKTPSTKNRAFFDGLYQFVTPSDLSFRHYYCRATETTVTGEARDKHKNQFIPDNAVMFTCIGNTIGKCALSSEPCLTNQQINSIIPYPEFDPRFIYYLMLSNEEKVRGIGIGGGAAMPIVNKTAFSKIRVQVPPKPIQEMVASVLSTYDDLIENNRRRIQLLEQAARLLYKEWFVHLRFPGHEHVKIKNDVPEGWEERKIEDICDTVGGGTPSTKKSEYWDDGDIIWVVPTDVTRNDCLALLDSEKKITEAGLRSSSAKIVPPDTILMTSRASVGFFALMEKEACTNQGFINIIPHHDCYRMYILYNLMWRVEEIRSHAGGTTYKEISKGRFRPLSITIPTKHIAKEFNELTCRTLTQIRLLKKQQMKLIEARDILLPRLMNGDIAV